MALDDHQRTTLLVGLGKASSRWKASHLAKDLGITKESLLWLLRQLASLCNIANTRYGYAQTDEALVACRFSRSGDEWSVDFKCVPWTAIGQAGALTTDLVLWWLTQLAMVDDHRGIVQPDDVVEIDAWGPPFPAEHCWKHRHRYSNAERVTAPPPVGHVDNVEGDESDDEDNDGDDYRHEDSGDYMDEDDERGGDYEDDEFDYEDSDDDD